MRWAAAILGLLLVACPAQRRHGEDAGTDAGAADAGPPPPPELQVTLQSALGDGGSEVLPLEEHGATDLSVTDKLVVTTNRPLRNVRIRLFDEADKALESDDALSESPDGGLRDEVSLLAPLRSGHRYALVLDPQSGSALLDDSGGTLAERRYELHTLGEREKDAPRAKPGKRRRH